jgi:hypothetical protein
MWSTWLVVGFVGLCLLYVAYDVISNFRGKR